MFSANTVKKHLLSETNMQRKEYCRYQAKQKWINLTVEFHRALPPEEVISTFHTSGIHFCVLHTLCLQKCSYGCVVDWPRLETFSLKKPNPNQRIPLNNSDHLFTFIAHVSLF